MSYLFIYFTPRHRISFNFKQDDSDGEVEEVKEKPAPRKRKAPVKKVSCLCLKSFGCRLRISLSIQQKVVEEDNDSAEEITIPADLSGSDDEKETKKPTKVRI